MAPGAMEFGLSGSLGACCKARSAVVIASPIAVESCSWMLLIAFSTVWCAVVSRSPPRWFDVGRLHGLRGVDDHDHRGALPRDIDLGFRSRECRRQGDQA